MAEKKCSKCGEVKPLEQFYKQKWCSLGVRPECRACCYVACRARIAADPSKEKAYKKAYREARRDELVARDKAYYQANKERLKKSQLEYNRRNKDSYNARLRRWRAEHPEQVQVWVRNRRAKLRGLDGSHSLSDILAMVAQQKGRCVYCKADIREKYEVDHVLPVSKGGSNDKSNLQLLCRTCNLDKRALHPVEYAQKRGLLI